MIKNNAFAYLLLCSFCLCCSRVDQSEIDKIYETRITEEEREYEQLIEEDETEAEIKNPKGHCDTREIRRHLYAENIEFANNVDSCVYIKYFSLSADFDSVCLKNKYPELPDGCVDCFAQLTRCAVNHCKKDCALYGKTSLDCKACTTDACTDDWVKCAGVSRILIPDLR